MSRSTRAPGGQPSVQARVAGNEGRTGRFAGAHLLESAAGPLVAIFAVTLAIGVLFAVMALSSLRTVSHHLEVVISDHADAVVAVERLTTYSERMGRVGRAYVLTQDHRFVEELAEARAGFDRSLALLAPRLDAEGRARLEEIRRIKERHVAVTDEIIAARQSGALEEDDIAARFGEALQPVRDRLDDALDELRRFEREAFAAARRHALDSTSRAFRTLAAGLVTALLLSAVLGAFLFRTLSRLRRNRQALEQMMVRLESANGDLDAFSGRVAHDLRNILTPLTMIAERLRSRADRPDVVGTCAERVERSAARANDLIDVLLSFARAGQPPDPHARASVKAAIDGALEDLEERRRQADAQVEVQVQDALVACTPALLHAVVLNLVGNAFKYIVDSPRRLVLVSARTEGGRCMMVVEDTGPGIPPEGQAQIFRPFYRVPGTNGPGTGIGLATVQRIVDAHGGSVSVESQPGQGTRFTVSLPLASPVAETASALVSGRPVTDP
jgi:signal transduction histidine kinase